MTYREKIQEMIATIDKLYDESEALRDYAIELEKDFWNRTRSNLDAAKYVLDLLDNGISDGRAQMKID